METYMIADKIALALAYNDYPIYKDYLEAHEYKTSREILEGASHYKSGKQFLEQLQNFGFTAKHLKEIFSDTNCEYL